MSEESTVYTIPLHKFCAQSDEAKARFHISRPFNFGRYTYSTDGRIIVRVPKASRYSTLFPVGLKIARGARDIFKKFPKHGFIAIDIPKKKDVPRNSYKLHVVRIGASNFNMQFLLAMKRLPNLKVRPPRVPLDIMPFTFDGGIGKLMPTFAKASYTIKICRASVPDASNTKQKGNQTTCPSQGKSRPRRRRAKRRNSESSEKMRQPWPRHPCRAPASTSAA